MPVVCLVLLIAVAVAVTDREADPRSSAPRSTTSAPPEIPQETVWSLTPGDLRTDLPGAQFVSSIDGDFESGYVTGVAGLWLTLTGNEADASTVLHAIDPATGTQRWQRALDGVLCTTEAPASGVLCASVLDRDPATGLGTRWRLHQLDPATGEDLRTRDVDAWVSAVHWTGTSFVLLEQRQPSPHAVLRAFAGDDLRPLWDTDLRSEPRHDELFSENRIVRREEPERPGLALDRPRLRDVGDGLVAVWAGQSTAFLDASDGRLVMFPHCSRLVDDRKRLWCNETDGASAYSYAGAKLFRIKGPRLAFPNDDGVGIDRTRPVFIDDRGAGVSVNTSKGTVGRAYTPPGSGSAFGEVTMPSASTVGDHTFLVGKAGTMLLDPDADDVAWTNPDITLTDLPILLGDRVLLGTSRLDAVELTTGRATGRVRIDATYVVQVGKRLAATGPDRLALVRVG